MSLVMNLPTLRDSHMTILEGLRAGHLVSREAHPQDPLADLPILQEI
jgi:hypothetical protein